MLPRTMFNVLFRLGHVAMFNVLFRLGHVARPEKFEWYIVFNIIRVVRRQRRSPGGNHH